jgi:AraC-like DNA-binding protein
MPKHGVFMEIYHSDLTQYIKTGRLPLYVEDVTGIAHPERLFHDHDYSEIALITAGEALHVAAGKTARIEAGDILVLHPGCMHAYDRTDGMRLINVLYKREKLPMPLLDGHSLPLFHILFPNEKNPPPENALRPVMRLKPEDIHPVFTLIKELEKEIKGILPGCMHRALGLFMELTVRLARLSGYESPGIKERFVIGDVIEFMRGNLNRKITVDELMRTAKMSRRNFFRQFKLAAGCSPVEYLLGLRLEKAAGMLVMTEKSAGEIALECGFGDSNYFCRMFRRKHGVSPLRHRAAARKKTSCPETVNPKDNRPA